MGGSDPRLTRFSGEKCQATVSEPGCGLRLARPTGSRFGDASWPRSLATPFSGFPCSLLSAFQSALKLLNTPREVISQGAGPPAPIGSRWRGGAAASRPPPGSPRVAARGREFGRRLSRGPVSRKRRGSLGGTPSSCLWCFFFFFEDKRVLGRWCFPRRIIVYEGQVSFVGLMCEREQVDFDHLVVVPPLTCSGRVITRI